MEFQEQLDLPPFSLVPPNLTPLLSSLLLLFHYIVLFFCILSVPLKVSSPFSRHFYQHGLNHHPPLSLFYSLLTPFLLTSSPSFSVTNESVHPLISILHPSGRQCSRFHLPLLLQRVFNAWRPFWSHEGHLLLS